MKDTMWVLDINNGFTLQYGLGISDVQYVTITLPITSSNNLVAFCTRYSRTMPLTNSAVCTVGKITGSSISVCVSDINGSYTGRAFFWMSISY